jgi:hypothetical protein
VHLLGDVTAIYDEFGTGHERCLVGSEEQHAVGNLGRKWEDVRKGSYLYWNAELQAWLSHACSSSATTKRPALSSCLRYGRHGQACCSADATTLAAARCR